MVEAPCCIIEVFHTFQVFLGIDRFYLDLLRCFPASSNAIGALPFFSILRMKAGKYVNVFKIRFHGLWLFRGSVFDKSIIIIQH